MNVRELIALLAKENPNAVVIASVRDGEEVYTVQDATHGGTPTVLLT